MDNVKDVAAYLVGTYTLETGTPLAVNGQRLANLLYLAQREQLAVKNRPLYKEKIFACSEGARLKALPQLDKEQGIEESIREMKKVVRSYENGEFNGVSLDTQYCLRNVVKSYKDLTDEQLKKTVKEQLSWKKASNSGDKKYDLEDIRLDSRKIRPYDHFYNTYYDEEKEEF